MELSEKTFTPRIQVRSTAHVLEKKLGLWVSSDPKDGSGLPEKGLGGSPALLKEFAQCRYRMTGLNDMYRTWCPHGKEQRAA